MGKRDGYQSLLRQADLIKRIRFPSQPDFYGCELPDIHFFLIDGMDFRHPGRSLFMRLGSFSTMSDLAEVGFDAAGNGFISQFHMRSDIPQTTCNIEMLPVTPDNRMPAGSIDLKVEGIWRTISVSKKLKQPFIEWWSTSKVLRCGKKHYSRQELIDYVANQSGGAHVSPSLNEKDLYKYEVDQFKQLKNIEISKSGLHKTVQVIGVELLDALRACD